MTVLHAYVASSCAACYTLVGVAGNNLTNRLSECGVTKQALQNTACVAVLAMLEIPGEKFICLL